MKKSTKTLIKVIGGAVVIAAFIGQGFLVNHCSRKRIINDIERTLNIVGNTGGKYDLTPEQERSLFYFRSTTEMLKTRIKDSISPCEIYHELMWRTKY